MDLFSFLTDLVNSQSSGFVAGIIAALTPCALAMIPVALYAFGLKQQSRKSLIKALLIFLISFVGTFLIFGLFLQNILSGTLVNVARIVIGVSLILAAFFTSSGTTLAGWLQRFSSPWAIGLSMPLAISLSPCVLPWLAINATGTSQILPMALFGLGLTVPSILIALAGSSAINVVKNVKKVTRYLEVLSPILLVLAGIYMLFQLMQPTIGDVLAGLIFVFIVTFYIALSIFKRKELRTLYNFAFLIIALTANFSILLVSLPIVTENSYLSAMDVIWRCHFVPSAEVLAANNTVAFVFAVAGFILGFWWLSRSRKSISLAFN